MEEDEVEGKEEKEEKKGLKSTISAFILRNEKKSKLNPKLTKERKLKNESQ